VRCSILSVILSATALAAGDARAEPHGLITAAVRTHPAGAIAGGELLFDVAPDLRVGPFLNYAFYWAEAGGKLEWRYLDGLLIGGLSLGAEPGAFIRATTIGDERELGVRALARARLELNLKLERVWLYNRFTAEGRLRSFAERDPYRDAILDRELSIEEAIAPLVAVARFSETSALWVYAELTVATEATFGLLDLRPSAGLIAEEIIDGVTLDLDFYYSLRDGPIRGFGVLLFLWWRIE
jgi:hypothetical protein